MFWKLLPIPKIKICRTKTNRAALIPEWPDMTLEKKYEDSIINLCMTVLEYLNKLMEASDWFGGESAEAELASYMARIADADAACRGFTITIVPKTGQQDRGKKRTVEEAEDEGDDSSGSDSTLAKGESRGELLPSAKRVRV